MTLEVYRVLPFKERLLLLVSKPFCYINKALLEIAKKYSYDLYALRNKVFKAKVKLSRITTEKALRLEDFC